VRSCASGTISDILSFVDIAIYHTVFNVPIEATLRLTRALAIVTVRLPMERIVRGKLFP